MVREGFADFAITEDSDLIAYGCTRLFLKINWKGKGQDLDFSKMMDEK